MIDVRSVLVAAAFVAVLAVHVALLVAMTRRAPLRAAAALVVPPLVPYWGYRLGMRRRAIGWAVAVVAYVIALIVARL